MSWTRVSALLPVVLAACARVNTMEESADAGPSQPTVTAVEPQPGPAEATAKFTVHFSAPMDEAQLLAPSGRSETVVLVADADVERAAAAIEHAQLSAHERELLVPAEPEISADRTAMMLAPDQPLPAGSFWLLVSPRVKDDGGRHLAGTGARFAFQVKPPAPRPRLVSPAAGADAPSNLIVVRAFAQAGRLALLGPGGEEAAAADAHGDVALSLAAPLVPGARYALALDGAQDADQWFTASSCARDAAPALEGGQAQLSARDTSVLVRASLDWPAQVVALVGDAADGEPCAGACQAAAAYVSCTVPACGPQAFPCAVELKVDGLRPARDYALRVVAQDDLGHESKGPLQRFATVAPLPRVIVSEVMAAPPSPQGEAEYVEILNQGPGLAVLDALALQGADGIARPLSGTPPPIPVQLAPGARALAVGSAFALARYPDLPGGVPVLRASTQRLLGRGLADGNPPEFSLILQGSVPVELARFPGGGPPCAAGASLQRDETAPPDADAAWACGRVGGTPGSAP